MSANHSLILFEGDILSRLPEVLECFGLHTTGQTETAKGLSEIWEYTNYPRKNKPKNVVHKAVLYNGIWTAVLDREMNMVLNQERCEYCAKKFNIKVFGYLVETVSGTCALYMYQPEKVRGLNIQNFEVLEDFGEPLPQETGITTQELFEDGMMRISRRMGFSDSLFAHPTSRVYVVGAEDPELSNVLERIHSSAVKHPRSSAASANLAHKRQEIHTVPPTTRLEKPWWKLW
ncbi:hypothetical protein FACS189427_06590 [Planctomycetales bacterium]|nr:hypothetical protein FACS189427_06590 [Planctomycetales bacterium]